MNKQDIQVLYEYNRWANARILGAASKISEAQFLAPTTFPHGGFGDRASSKSALTPGPLSRRRRRGGDSALSCAPLSYRNGRGVGGEGLLRDFDVALLQCKTSSLYHWFLIESHGCGAIIHSNPYGRRSRCGMRT